MNSIKVRLATEGDNESLLNMPSYSKNCSGRRREDVLVAETGGVILGAVSVGHKDISCVLGNWNDGFVKNLSSLVNNVSGAWISKLYVFPEYRCRGIGTRLVREAVEHLKGKKFSEVYAGIYVQNKFRELSEDVFRDNGFESVGSCICFLDKGHCRGILLRKTFGSGEQRLKKRRGT
jgi:GNAT superfamily N-acetyltransferase